MTQLIVLCSVCDTFPRPAPAPGKDEENALLILFNQAVLLYAHGNYWERGAGYDMEWMSPMSRVAFIGEERGDRPRGTRQMAWTPLLLSGKGQVGGFLAVCFCFRDNLTL